MKLSGLKALVAAVEEGSLRAAARQVGLSQPAMTKALRELEREVGAPLLLRSTTGVVATAQGRVLYDHARAVERELAGAVETIGQLGGRMRGELNVSAVPAAVTVLIPETIRTYAREFPEVRLRLREELYVAQLGHLRDGDVDVIVGPIPESLPPGEFTVEPLMPLRMAVVAGKGSPLAKARSLAQLRDARWVFTSTTGRTSYARLLFEQHGLPPPAPAAIANSTLSLLALIAGGDHVGLMPEPLMAHPATAPFLSVVPVKEGMLQLELGAIARKEAMLKPLVRHFVAHLHRAAQHAHGPAEPRARARRASTKAAASR